MADQARQEQDHAWLTRLLAGDHEAFAEFVDKYKGTVFLCCRTLGLNKDEAEDVAGETFLAAYKTIGRYSGRAELGTWLWSIAYRQGVNFLRKNQRRKELLNQPNTTPAVDEKAQPETMLQTKEEEEIVWETVGRLPRLWALTVLLYYREHKSVKDIAKIMRTRRNTIKTYLFRARKRLHELLTDVLGEDIDVSR